MSPSESAAAEEVLAPLAAASSGEAPAPVFAEVSVHTMGGAVVFKGFVPGSLRLSGLADKVSPVIRAPVHAFRFLSADGPLDAWQELGRLPQPVVLNVMVSQEGWTPETP